MQSTIYIFMYTVDAILRLHITSKHEFVLNDFYT